MVKEVEVIKEVEVVKEVEKIVEVPAEGRGIEREFFGEDLHSFIYTGPAPTSYGESPLLAAMVAAGELPPVEDRLPNEPMIIPTVERIGDYGGTWRRGFTGPNDNENMNRLTPDHILMWDTNGVDIYPNIAKAWDVNEDDTVFTLYLREGMKWSDGAPFTADDFEFAKLDVIENVVINPGRKGSIGGGGAGGSGFAPRFEKIDQYTIRYHFDSPVPAFLDELASPGVGEINIWVRAGGSIAYPAHYLKQFHIDYGDPAQIEQWVKDGEYESWATLFLDKADAHRNPDVPMVGPWKVTVPPTEQTWELERNPYYWVVDEEGNQLPYIDKIVMSLFTNTEVLALRAMRGDVDYQRRHVGLDKLPLLIASQDIGNYRVQLTDHPGGTGFTWNLTYAEDQYINELFNNTEFRQAMAIATDREGFYEAFFQGMGYMRNASPLPSHGFYLGEKYDTLWNYLDADQANAMLDGIGLTSKDSSGFRLRADGSGPITIEVGCVTGYFANYCGMADLLRAQWAENVGIKVAINPMDVSLYGDRREKNLNMTMVSGGPSGRAPYNALQSYSDLAPAVGLWHETDGEQGVAPFGVIKELNDIALATMPLKQGDRKEPYQRGFMLQIENALGITLNHAAPGFMGVLVVKENFRNTPIGVPDISHIPVEQRPDQWFFIDGKNDAGY